MVEAISAANSAVKASAAIKGQQRPELTVSDVRDFQFRLVAPLLTVDFYVPVTPMRLAAAVPVPVRTPPPVPHVSAAIVPPAGTIAWLLQRERSSPAPAPPEVPVPVPPALAALKPDTVPYKQWPKVRSINDGRAQIVTLTDETSIAGLLCVCAAQKALPTSPKHCRLKLEAVSRGSLVNYPGASSPGSMSWEEFWDVLGYCWPNLIELALMNIEIPKEAAAALSQAAARHWPKMMGLLLPSCCLDGAGLRATVALPSGHQ